MIKLDIEKCNGCKLCVKACLFGGIKVEAKTPGLTDFCTACGVCVDVCKQEAISSSGEKQKGNPNKDQYNGIWIIAEQIDGQVQNISYELLGKASELATKRGCQVSAVILGNGTTSSASDDLLKHGAHRVYFSDAPFLERYRTLPYERIISELIGKHKPEVILFGATPMGRDLAPRIANTFKTGLTADCTGLDITDGGELLQTRPAFGGNVMATIYTPEHRPQMATVRPGVMQKALANGSQGEKVQIEAKEDERDKLVEILKVIKKEKSGVNLEQAEVIVSGGRGLGEGKNFQMLKDLAKALNGEVAASRGAVELGWVPQARQVGQTGKTVRPKIYIACGISGAIQHMAGMENSDVIIAINKDPEAPIVKAANYSLIGDLNTIVPELLRVCKEV